MKIALFTSIFSILASTSFASVSVTELAIRTEGEVVNGKPFLTVSYENGVLVDGKLGDKYVVASGACRVPGLTVGLHKAGNCDQNFAMVTCQDGKFKTIIRISASLESYVDRQISVSEYPTGFGAPNKCGAPAATIRIK